ncbi:MAG: carboxypeptidase-like regulatory domain-containing protein [Leptospirales bacterium]
MSKRNIYKLSLVAFWASLLVSIMFTSSGVFAATVTLSGTITEASTGKPIEFASIAILELKKKILSDENGKYKVSLSTGNYTLIISASGYKTQKHAIKISKSVTADFSLSLPIVSGNALSIEAERDVQKISRYSMSKEEIKNVPATLGDSFGAVSSMAGIERSGFLGPLSIRGLGDFANRYYIDGVLIRKPQHFGGFHSIIHNEFISEIDIFSSSFPLNYGYAVGSIIEINTIDEVKKTYGFGDIGILSANFMVGTPLYKMQAGEKKVNGYILVGARYGYLTLIAPYIIKATVGDTVNIDTSYYDYQFKGKYFLNKNNSLTILLFGGADRYTLDRNLSSRTTQNMISKGADPYRLAYALHTDSKFHSQSLLYTYMPSYMFSNEARFYTSLNDVERRRTIDDTNVVSWARNINLTSRPNIYGLRDDLKYQTKKKTFSVKLGLDMALYHYVASGKNIYPKTTSNGQSPDYSDPDAFVVKNIHQDARNYTIGNYIETKLTLDAFELALGLRSDYLTNQEYFVWDPRGIVSYTFPWQTTISAAGGGYSAFYQTNFDNLERSPDVIKADAKPERAWHRAVGIEQKIGKILSFKVEGYYNNFYQLTEPGYDPAGKSKTFTNSVGERKTYGVEFTQKFMFKKGDFSFLNWLSYTYGKSEHKSNLSAALDPYGDKWLNGENDRRHSFKMVTGATFGKHMLGTRFQYYTSNPFTPIVGDDNDPGGIGRYGPLYGKSYSKYSEPDHRLDIRYSYDTARKWGRLRWYVEAINVLNIKPKDRENWKYNKKYKKGVNPVRGTTAILGFAPNFGLEISF